MDTSGTGAHRQLDRRSLFKLMAGAAVVAGTAPLTGRPAFGASDPEDSFTVEIEGLTLPHVISVAIDDTVIDKREVTTGLDVEYRLFAPGATHWGQASFTRAMNLGPSKELKPWFDQAASGKDIRKSITVSLFRSGALIRTLLLLDACPTAYSSQTFDASSEVQTETLTVKVARIDFKV